MFLPQERNGSYVMGGVDMLANMVVIILQFISLILQLFFKNLKP